VGPELTHWLNFSDLRWQDLLDISLLSIIFYRILILIKGTRTIPMLMGFVLLLALYLISAYLQLNATRLLLDNLASSLVLVLVVLFQADIRNALAHIGLFTLFRDNDRQQRDAVEQILQACRVMARQRIGALIVLEREVGLRNYTERGTLLEAQVSEELLLSIFHPTSPLHDGAVLISRKGGLVAAQCLLPVSMNSKISSILGTRHRAAIGLTEETDAVVLVVSEERKELSLAHRGRLFRGTPEQLREGLFDLLAGKEPTGLEGQFPMERPESAEDADSVKDPAAEPQTSKVLSEAG
jgi:diadenylate cyclase